MSTVVLPMERAAMSVAALRLGARHPSVEALLARIDGLARERQELRVGHAAARTLERNRLALVRSQWELSYALIARHVSPASARDAA
jgi:hypothetical protein